MNIKYAIYDAKNGENIIYNTKEEAIDAFWLHVISFAKSHFHNTAYMTVQYNEDGSETWFNDSNQEIEKPMTAQEKLDLVMKAHAQNLTPVEVLP